MLLLCGKEWIFCSWPFNNRGGGWQKIYLPCINPSGIQCIGQFVMLPASALNRSGHKLRRCRLRRSDRAVWGGGLTS